jgi:dihydropyrimidine dehydrogenase (NAD+) subunit PreA
MADLYVKSLDMQNPFIIASSPATQGVKGVLKSAEALPGAIVMRNFGHGAGGGSFISPSGEDMRKGKSCIQIHGVGTQIRDPISTLEEYCEGVLEVKKKMSKEIKLWVSVGHYSDIVSGKDWEKDWVKQAVELENAGADALELHFNTPGVAVGRNRIFDYYRLVYNSTKMIKKAVKIPVMVKLPVEACDPLRAMETAVNAGADAIGPTARWKGFVVDLDWRQTQARPGAGYGGTQALPIISYNVAEARMNGIDTPIYAGGGVFSWDAAAKLIMAGSQSVQLGSAACCLGPKAVGELIKKFDKWMDEKGYGDIDSLCGDALTLLKMPKALSDERTRRIGRAYREASVDKTLCIGCGRCMEACWHEGIEIMDKHAEKTERCIGCGYCFQVCPTKALHVNSGEILSSVFNETK